MAKPLIGPALDGGSRDLKKYLDGLELQPGETGTTVLVDFDKAGNGFLFVVALKDKTIVRKIAQFSKDQIVDAITKLM